ncbi:tyrosine-type recombinase/integrase [Streptomyces sp. MI02-7b]|uniref:tyrosine-type recombinase/integrase n=1 Tax=Streptomyces sp. MI02-7b TaxID=462941 RepID=UPI0029CA5A96|nr:tyrosine-type recombinase/integrase [Streptomyces sp. MI02-7b]
MHCDSSSHSERRRRATAPTMGRGGRLDVPAPHRDRTRSGAATEQIRRVRVHDLRHTRASLLLTQGVDARTIMETLGHSTITMTLDTYAHVMRTTLRAAADRMDDALGLDDEGEGDDGDAVSIAAG